MLQILEEAPDASYFPQGRWVKSSLGKGQQIEKDMAESMHLKVFRVCAPEREIYGDRGSYEIPFSEYEINQVVSKVRQWYEGGCADMSSCNIGFYYNEYEDKEILEVRNGLESVKFFR